MFRRFAAVLVVTPLVVLLSGAGGKQPTDRNVDVGSHSLHAVVVGEGAPAVVFDGGIGASCGDYRALQTRIAATTTVVTYDRAGYGSSDAGPLPRDSKREVQELKALLSGLGIPGPYVLVGHSLGGLNVEVYAGLHPEDVAGMVLLDPPPLRFILGEAYPQLAAMGHRMTDEWQGTADRGLHSGSPGDSTRGAFFQMLASEHREMFGSSAHEAASIDSFGDIPLVVVASGVPNPAFGDVAQSYQRFWAAQSESLAAKSSRGKFVFAENSTHRLQDDAADLVAGTILSMVKSLRGPVR